MALRLLVAAPMRYLGLLFALSLIASPAMARKHQKHATAQRSIAPPPEAAEPAPPPPEVRHFAPPAAQVAQADDEEVPGGKRRKK